MRVAAIDIGTNSIRLLKAEIVEGHLKSGPKLLEMTRIGQGVNETGLLAEEAMERSVKALAKFKAESDTWGAEKLFALATSAVRDSENRDVFIEMVKKQAGIDIEVIQGDEEARLGFTGVLAGIENLEESVLVIDVGGGSTEFIVGNANGIKFAKSVNVGAVRMTGKHVATDPITEDAYQSMQRDIEQLVEDVVHTISSYDIGKIIGIGGTATSLGTMKLEMEVYDRDVIQNTYISIDEIQHMNENMKNMNLEQRREIKGLQPKRADVMLAGAMIIENALRQLNIEGLFASDFDNLEGCLVERLNLKR